MSTWGTLLLEGRSLGIGLVCLLQALAMYLLASSFGLFVVGARPGPPPTAPGDWSQVAVGEVDHVDAAARGGRATLDRLRLLCKGHSLLHADAVYGREHMRKYRKGTVTDLGGSSTVPMAREAMAAG